MRAMCPATATPSGAQQDEPARRGPERNDANARRVTTSTHCYAPGRRFCWFRISARLPFRPDDAWTCNLSGTFSSYVLVFIMSLVFTQHCVQALGLTSTAQSAGRKSPAFRRRRLKDAIHLIARTPPDRDSRDRLRATPVSDGTWIEQIGPVERWGPQSSPSMATYATIDAGSRHSLPPGQWWDSIILSTSPGVTT